MQLKLAHYEQLGGIKGSIEAAVERAFKARRWRSANAAATGSARLALLRRGLIPWLAGIDPETGAPRRRVATAVRDSCRGAAAHPSIWSSSAC